MGDIPTISTVASSVAPDPTPSVLALLDSLCIHHDGRDCASCTRLRADLVRWQQEHTGGQLAATFAPLVKVSRRKVVPSF